MESRVEPTSVSEDKAWLLRALLVLQSPRAVFTAMRDDSDEPARARQEPITALVLLAGIAAVLWTPVASTLLDQVVTPALFHAFGRGEYVDLDRPRDGGAADRLAESLPP